MALNLPRRSRAFVNRIIYVDDIYQWKDVLPSGSEVDSKRGHCLDFRTHH